MMTSKSDRVTRSGGNKEKKECGKRSRRSAANPLYTDFDSSDDDVEQAKKKCYVDEGDAETESTSTSAEVSIRETRSASRKLRSKPLEQPAVMESATYTDENPRRSSRVKIAEASSPTEIVSPQKPTRELRVRMKTTVESAKEIANVEADNLEGRKVLARRSVHFMDLCEPSTSSDTRKSNIAQSIIKSSHKCNCARMEKDIPRLKRDENMLYCTCQQEGYGRVRKQKRTGMTRDEMAVFIAQQIYDRPKLLLGKSFNKQLFDDAVALVKRSYDKVRNQYDKDVARLDVDFVLNGETSELKNFQPRTWKGQPVMPLVLDFQDVDEHFEFVEFSHEECTSEEKYDSYVVPRNPLPYSGIEMSPMRPFFHIETNIKSPDRYRLNFAPWVDKCDMMRLYMELHRRYEEGVFGDTVCYGNYVNQWIVYQVLRKCYEKWTRKDKSHLHCAVFTLFPDVLSFRQLQHTGYLNLESRFNKVEVKQRNQENFENIKKEFPYFAEKAAHSVQSIFCTRCCVFSCQVHDVEEMGVTGPQLPLDEMYSSDSDHENVSTAEPCCDSCWKLVPKIEVTSTRSRRTVEELLNADEPLFPVDKTMRRRFFTYIHVAAGDSCSFAKAMSSHWRISDIFWGPSKPTTCAQLHELCMRYWELSEDDALERARKNRVSETDATGRAAPLSAVKLAFTKAERHFRTIMHSGSGMVENFNRLYACAHEGPCKGNSRCPCLVCTKYCNCTDCPVKFPGCKCEPGMCNSRLCNCFLAKWECDPQTCLSCNCGPYDHPPHVAFKNLNLTSRTVFGFMVNGHVLEQEEFYEMEDKEVKRCPNSQMRIGHMKKVKVGVSAVAGWGCFLDEPAEEGELIGEYTGELISRDEAERRGAIYDRLKVSYIFTLNSEQAIDAARYGNLMRFANHASSHANCKTQVMVVEGEHRIGFYALRRIEKDEELFFDYQYEQHKKRLYVPKERRPKSLDAPARIFRSQELINAMNTSATAFHGGPKI